MNPGTSVARPHFPCLDAYRAIGMMMVFLAHAHYASIATDKAFFPTILDRFDSGLPIFFVLSAFLLFRPFVVSQFAAVPPMTSYRFYRHRIVRIFPAYWFALTVIVIWFGIEFASFRQGVAFYALLQDYGTGPVFEPEFQPIYQAWSLATELMFYALLPLFAWLMRGVLQHRPIATQVRALLAICGLLYLAGFLFRFYIVAGDPTWQKNGILWFPAWMDMFALGMALAVLSARMEHERSASGAMHWVARHPGAMWAVAGAIFGGLCIIDLEAEPFVLTKEYLLRQGAYGMFAVFFLLPGMFGDPEHGRIRAFLKHPVMAYFGAISLGFYLFHVAFLSRAEDWTGGDPFRANYIAIVAVALPLTLIAANFSYYVIERPFMRLKSGTFSRRGRRTPAQV
jgi:peptidoglycan/LPS O-acetylase OafA/YrhL